MFIQGQAAQLPQSANSAPAAETPMFDVYQHIFNLLFSTRASLPSDDARKTSVITFFISIGLDEKSANALFPYVRDGLAQQETYTRRAVAQLCKGKASIRSKTQLGDDFAAIYAEIDRMQSRIWGSFEILDARNRAILSAYAMKKKSQVDISPTDPRAIIRQSSETLSQWLERICKGN